jgi:hypothetical protein
MLRGQTVQPGESIRTGDADDSEMREVHCSSSLVERPLFAEWIAEVPRDTRIRIAFGCRYRPRRHRSSIGSRVGAGCPTHWAQRPCMDTWEISVWKP